MNTNTTLSPLTTTLCRPLSRRSTLLAFAGAAITPLMAGSYARAADMMGGSGDYAAQTLKIGGLALATSKQALYKATSPAVKTFAPLEVGEQETIAMILAAHGFMPSEMPEEFKAKLTKLEAMSGKDYDKAYVAAQIEGHNELLAVQKIKETGDAKDPQVIVAKMAAQSIMSHIATLKMIESMM